MLNSLESLPHTEDRTEEKMIRHNPEMFLSWDVQHISYKKKPNLAISPEVSEFTLELD